MSLAPCRVNKSGKNAHSAVVAEEHVLIVVALARLLQTGKHAMLAMDLDLQCAPNVAAPAVGAKQLGLHRKTLKDLYIIYIHRRNPQ